MHAERPSLTAAWVAVARGLGRLLPPEAQLVDDPYGVAFAGGGRLGRALAAAAERDVRAVGAVPGLRAWLLYMQVRTRLLDDVVREFVDGGGAQVVLLGAGYDCRALRLPGAARFFEVDHPNTQARKQRVLARLGAASPARYLAWDFEGRAIGELPAALAGLGHDAHAPTLTVWEGVTMYLTEPALDASVRAMAAYSSAGSALAMTYFTRDRLAAPRVGTRALMRALAGVGEPWRWGWRPDELPGWLAARGWRVERDLGMDAAAHALLPPRHAAFADDGRRVAVVARERVAVAARSPQ
ncbi:MAG: SAM-dependent methyltransferase [Kofleriaceae bacterium]